MFSKTFLELIKKKKNGTKASEFEEIEIKSFSFNVPNTFN